MALEYVIIFTVVVDSSAFCVKFVLMQTNINLGVVTKHKRNSNRLRIWTDERPFTIKFKIYVSSNIYLSSYLYITTDFYYVSIIRCFGDLLSHQCDVTYL